MTQKRFSLVELLFVIIIIMLLIGLILPMLQRSRERARRIICASNLNNIGIALLMYSREYDALFPTLNSPPTTNFEPLNIDNFLNDGKVWNCPSRTDMVTTAANSAYVYIGSGLRDASPAPSSDTLAYDLFGNHPGNEWCNVLFLDGHIEGGDPARTPYKNE